MKKLAQQEGGDTSSDDEDSSEEVEKELPATQQHGSNRMEKQLVRSGNESQEAGNDETAAQAIQRSKPRSNVNQERLPPTVDHADNTPFGIIRLGLGDEDNPSSAKLQSKRRGGRAQQKQSTTTDRQTVHRQKKSHHLSGTPGPSKARKRPARDIAGTSEAEEDDEDHDDIVHHEPTAHHADSDDHSDGNL